MKTYLVTGGAGFIGSNFVKYITSTNKQCKLVILDELTYAGNLGTIKEELKQENCKFIKGSICDRKLVDSVFTENEIDYVVNFAAESHVDRSIDNPGIFVETNVLGTQTLLDAARKHWQLNDNKYKPEYKNGVKFLQVSTDEVYGSLGETGYFTENTPLDPRSPYSASKASADLMVNAYSETYKMPVNITRCSNNYGPYHFPEKLIPLIIKNILEGKQLPVYGDGKNVRDWLYVEDHCEAIATVLHKGKAGEIYNVGGHNEKQNIEIVKLVIQNVKQLIDENPQYAKAIKKTGNGTDWINDDLITFVADRPGHDMRYAIDPGKIKADLGWFPKTNFETGIVKTIRWYLENQEWVDEVAGGNYQKYYEQMYLNR